MDTNRERIRIRKLWHDKLRMNANENLTQRRKSTEAKTTTADEPAVVPQARDYGGQAAEILSDGVPIRGDRFLPRLQR